MQDYRALIDAENIHLSLSFRRKSLFPCAPPACAWPRLTPRRYPPTALTRIRRTRDGASAGSASSRSPRSISSDVTLRSISTNESTDMRSSKIAPAWCAVHPCIGCVEHMIGCCRPCDHSLSTDSEHGHVFSGASMSSTQGHDAEVLRARSACSRRRGSLGQTPQARPSIPLMCHSRSSSQIL
jgi:hypothetical protein